MKKLTKPKAQGFLISIGDHWIIVDNERGVLNPLILPNQVGYTEYLAEVDALNACMSNQTALDSVVSQARDQRDLHREIVVPYINGFIHRANTYAGVVKGSGVLIALPDAVSSKDSVARINAAGSIVATEWQKLLTAAIPGLPSPLTLNGGVTLEQFSTAMDTFSEKGVDLDRERLTARQNRLNCNNLLYKTLQPMVVAYRRQILDQYPKDHTFVLSLPRLNSGSGSAPEAVVLGGTWNSSEQTVSLNWTACDHPELDHYEIRGCNEARYRTIEDIVISHVAKDKLTYSTTWGLFDGGSIASYRVYAVTKGQREKGSNPLTITRPDTLTANAA